MLEFVERIKVESEDPSEDRKSDYQVSPEIARCEERYTYPSYIKSVSTYRVTSTPKSASCSIIKSNSVLNERGTPSYSESFLTSSAVKPTPTQSKPQSQVQWQSEALESEDSRSPSPSLSNTSEKSIISNATFTKESVNVDDYSDDFESSGDEDTKQKSSSKSGSHLTEKESVVSCSPCDLSSNELSSSSTRHSQASSKSKPARTTVVNKTAVRKSNERERKQRSCDAGTMTEADFRLNSCLPPPPVWEEHSAFVAAVAASVERILTRHSAVPYARRDLLDTRDFSDAVNANSPCLKAVDRVLKEQLELTRAFLTTQSAMHEALKEALQQCTLPTMKPLSLHFNYTANTKTGT